jgi:hypothetical protein
MSTTTVSPELPLWVKDTFEFDLLKLMVPAFVDDDGVSFGGPVWHDDASPSAHSLPIAKLAEMVYKCREFGSDFIGKVVEPLAELLAEATERRSPMVILDLFELSKRANIAGDGSLMEVDQVLQSLCERFPEEIPYIEAAWSYGYHKPVHGYFGGGASFITAAGIDVMTTSDFLDNKRKEFANQPKPVLPGFKPPGV